MVGAIMGGDSIIKNLQNVCRACLCEDLTNNETNLMPTIQLNALNATYTHPNGKLLTRTEPLLKLLLSIVPELNIFESDLPNSLCSLCANKVIEAYDFQQMCLRAERKLREWLSNQKLAEFNNNSRSNTDANEEILEDPLSNNNNNNNKATKDNGEQKIIDEVNDSLGENNQINNFLKNETRTKCEMVDIMKSGGSSCSIDPINNNPLDNELNDTKNNTNCNLILDQCRNQYSIESFPTTHKQNENPSEDNMLLNKKFVCNECGHKLKTLKSLNRHQQIHQRLPEQIKKLANDRKTFHQCQFCNKAFQQSSTLKDHLRVHTGEQPFLCSECGKAFKSLSNMKQHLLRHSGDKRYECPECPKKFPCVSDLSSHKAVHNKIKSHVCDICGSAFIKPYQLKKHKMYHSGERPHKCEYCDMRFVLVHQMRRHLRTHTGEKPYKCKYCTRAFAQSNDLVKHLRNHLGDNIYKCELCPKAFRLIKDLRMHFTIHKNEDTEIRNKNQQALIQNDTNL